MSSSSDSDQSEVDEESANSISAVQAHTAPLSITVENSSDIKVGPHLQYNGPVTIKQYITVHSVENLDEISKAGPLQSASEFCRNAGHNGFPLGKMGFMEPDVLSQKKAANTTQEQGDNNQTLGNPFSWKWVKSHFSRFQLISVSLVLSLLIIVIIAVLIIYAGPDNTSQLQLIGSSGTLRVPSGIDAQWEVQSKVSHPLIFEWRNPKGEKLTIAQAALYRLWDNGHRTVVRLYDVTHNHSGIYVLRAYNLTAKFEQTIEVNLIIYDAGTPAHGKVVACYVANWASKRQGDGTFGVPKIDPTLCTHLIYAFAILDSNSSTIQSWMPDYDLEENGGKGSYKKTTALKKKHPELKVMLSIGGWAEGGLKYSKMANSPTRRKTFIASVSEFVRKYNFDGLDLHWIYPVVSWRNDGQAQFEDCGNLVILLKELREEFDKYGLLLTMPLGMTSDIIEDSYDIPGISKHLHYLFAMCYAYHTHYEDKTGPNAPLYSPDPDDKRNVESGIHLLLRKGAPPEKLVLGVPLYGRLFLIADDYKGDIHFGVPAKKGVSLKSYYVGEDGFWAYYEVCRLLRESHSTWINVKDSATRTPFAYSREEEIKFISYDDPESISQKVKYAVKVQLAGIMSWSIDTDDFRGSCSHTGATTFPLMRAVNKAIVEALRDIEVVKLSNTTSTVTEVTNNWPNITSTAIEVTTNWPNETSTAAEATNN